MIQRGRLDLREVAVEDGVQPGSRLDEQGRRMGDPYRLHAVAGSVYLLAHCYLRERHWHASQVLEDGPNGVVTMHLHVHPGPDLEAWIRSWGRLVEVLKDHEAREGEP